jgi:hypothetical protein
MKIKRIVVQLSKLQGYKFRQGRGGPILRSKQFGDLETLIHFNPLPPGWFPPGGQGTNFAPKPNLLHLK